MSAAAMAELRAMVGEVREVRAVLERTAERMERILEELGREGGGEAGPAWKRPDGRLTDAGIEVVNAAFAAGARVVDVAKSFDIHPSAASNRRRIWSSGRNG